MTVIPHWAGAEPVAPALTLASPDSPTDRNNSPRFGDLLSQRHARSDATEFVGDAVSARSDERAGGDASADVFNEHGFFHAVTTGSSQAGLSTSARSGIDAATAAPSDAVDGRDELRAPIAGTDTIPPAPGRTALAGEPGPAPSVHIERFSRAAVTGAAEVRGMTRAALLFLDGDGQRAAGTTPSRLLLLSRQAAPAGGALNPMVSLQAVEHGLRVVAQLKTLDRDERVRLRDRIAGLLSRHGLVAREIALNGQTSSAEDR